MHPNSHSHTAYHVCNLNVSLSQFILFMIWSCCQHIRCNSWHAIEQYRFTIYIYAHLWDIYRWYIMIAHISSCCVSSCGLQSNSSFLHLSPLLSGIASINLRMSSINLRISSASPYDTHRISSEPLQNALRTLSKSSQIDLTTSLRISSELLQNHLKTSSECSKNPCRVCLESTKNPIKISIEFPQNPSEFPQVPMNSSESLQNPWENPEDPLRIPQKVIRTLSESP